MYTHTSTCTHTDTHIPAHTYTHGHTHVHTQTHTLQHTHTHMYTHRHTCNTILLFNLILKVNDNSVLTETVKNDMYKCYPHAKRAHMKEGGNFPYLSRLDEVSVYIQVSTL